MNKKENRMIKEINENDENSKSSHQIITYRLIDITQPCFTVQIMVHAHKTCMDHNLHSN